MSAEELRQRQNSQLLGISQRDAMRRLRLRHAAIMNDAKQHTDALAERKVREFVWLSMTAVEVVRLSGPVDAATTDYAISAAIHSSLTRQFAGGTRSAISLTNDFEDWKSGTHRWKLNQGSDPLTTAGVGWNTFDFVVIGSLELSAGYLIFDTDAAELRGDVVLRGEIRETAEGTKVAVFNFLTVYLGKDVRVRFIGSTAVSIMSRSSMIIDTELQIRPGTLGGFPGGGFIGVGATSNNRNGPGSSSVRVYIKTVSTFGMHVPEIQEIETSAAPGQKIQGHFVLLYGDDASTQTQPIAYDATSYDVQKALEIAFPDIGSLNVERDDTAQQVPESGRLWRVTFQTAVGNVPQLRAKSFLKALSSKVTTRTIRDGNQLSGTFRLGLLNNHTRALPHDISANDLRAVLLEDFPHLLDARVTRTDPQSQCIQGSTKPDQSATTLTSPTAPGGESDYDPSHWMVPNELLVDSTDSVKNYPDKLCAGGRGAADGYVWKVQFWTREGNQMPLSPTSPTAQLVDAAAPLTVDFADLNGLGASAEVVDSLSFSLAFGGAGASFASKGGEGYSNPYRLTRSYAQTYSNYRVSDLLGGSGGAGGGLDPIDIFPVVQPTLGGAGAGALMLSAVNDLLIGHHGKLLVNGGYGRAGFTAGGGGSGGTVLLICGGAISHHGAIEALGGHGGSSSAQNNNQIQANPGGGGSGGRVAIFAQSFSSWGDGSILLNGGASQDPTRVGGMGSLFVQVETNLAIRVDPTIGAAGTFKSLLVDGSENYDSGGQGTIHTKSHQMSRNGPRFVLNEPSQPTRISYFVRIGNFAEGKVTTNRGAIFGVHDGVASGDNKDEFMIALAIIDGSFTHEANTFQWPRRQFQQKIQPDRWYKVDLLLNWAQHTYSIHLNDVLKVRNAGFKGEGVGSLSLNSLHAMSTWWDEIYVGEDYLMGFECPYVTSSPASKTSYSSNQQYGNGNGVVVVKKRSLRKLWAKSFQSPETAYHPMVKHESHLTSREELRHDNGSIVPFDGEPHRAFLNDIREAESELPDGSGEEDLSDSGVEILCQSEMLEIPGLPQDSTIALPLETGVDLATLAADRSSSTRTNLLSRRTSVYWYSEVLDENTLVGGVGACSTLDYIEWRNEGIVVHFVNLTDPFGNARGDLFADRPKVIFNNKSGAFVMWMHVDNKQNTMGLSGVATAQYPNGPFSFERSFYPEGAPLEAPGGQSINETHDQTIALIPATSSPTGEPQAFLLRSYYKTVEYWLPRAVMDPLWQSVQTSENKTDFGLSYHRAFYHRGYDNPNDIYLQRWRMEDMPWQLICCEPTNASNCVSYTNIPSNPNETCPDGMEKKQILGQSQMGNGSHITSRYKDPNDDINSFFLPHSVRSHTSWGFQVYNVKTWRGNYFDALSTNITQFIFKRFAGERRRLEIEKNREIQFDYPSEEDATCDSIPTNDTEVLDLLLGTLGVPVSAAFTKNHSSYDLLEIDINRDGKITSSEIATLKWKGEHKELTAELVTSLLGDFESMKWRQIALLDANGDGTITFPEFEAWVGLDTNLLFDKFDIDKNGYLDENELARTMWYRQIPRLDTIMILLDPSFDGRVYYQRFRALVHEAPNYVFKAYDFDKSGTLTQNEIDLMIKDLGPAFADSNVFDSLKNATTNSISKAKYAAWFSSTTSLLGDARNTLKVDNAVHATRPDRLTGPLHVVEQRRAKYIAISRLTSDYLGTEGLLREIEGDFEGREALMSYFEFAEQLFGLSDEDFRADMAVASSPGDFRTHLSSEDLHDRASYWNGRHWEGRPSAPPLFTYGAQCLQVAGVDFGDALSGCLPCSTRSPYVSSAADEFQAQARSDAHCHPQKELDAYIKEFDQQVSIQLQYQQQALFGPQGLQPHMSPCFNQSQFFPCDVHKVLDGNVADALRDAHARETPWHAAWERHPNNAGSSVQIRADGAQLESRGPSFTERFPSRLREPLTAQALDSVAASAPDQLADVLGGGS